MDEATLQLSITTIAPLVLIVGAFVYFLKESLRLGNLTKRLSKLGSENLLEELAKMKLGDIVQQYKSTIRIKTSDGDKTNYPASACFSGDAISWAYRINLRALGAAPGTLVGLGLLFTFIGLMIGINGFSGGTSKEVMNSINKLLQGMWMAFSTSVAGMLGSIVFTVFYKRVSNRFSKQLLRVTEALDAVYYIDDVSLQAGVMREILTENEEQSRALKSFTTDLAGGLQGLLEDVLSSQMQELLQNLVDHLDELGRKIQSPASDMVGSVVEDLKNSMAQVIDEFRKNLSGSATSELENLATQLGATSEAMAALPKDMENISSTLQVVIQDVKAVISDISNTNASDRDAAMQQMQEQIKFATSSIGDAVNTVRDVMKQMTQNSQNSADGIMKKMSDAMEGMTQRLEDATGHISDALKSNIGQIVGDMAAKQAEMIDGVKAAVDRIAGTGASVNESVMKSIDEAINGVKGVMTQISDSSLKASQDAINKMTEAAGKLDQHLNSALSHISGNVSGMTDQMAGQMNAMLGEIKNAVEKISSTSVNASEQVMKSIGDQVASATNLVSEASDKIRETTAQITGSLLDSSKSAIQNMSDAADRIRGILENSAGVFSEAVKSKLIEMMTEITGKQKTILDLQNNTVTRTQGLLNGFNQSLDHLDDTNDSISGTMDMFQKAQGQITGSTAHLQNVAGDMKTAAELLNNSLNGYSQGMDRLQSSTQATVASAESLMQQSGAMSKEYAEQFETIRTGLVSVFGQLQRGLTEYSRTVQATTQNYLDQYTASLTKTADSLSGAIQQMNEVVEMLLDVLKKNK